MPFLEVIAFNYESALLAEKAGANRLELCSNAAVGGTTPSYGFIKKCIEEVAISSFPMIRCRGGNFVYSKEEKELMAEDIKICQSLGCKGIVFGILNEDDSIDITTLKLFMELAEGMDVTFHRAFDRVKNPLQALEQIIEAGCKRILTSGQKPTASEGLSLIKKCVETAKDRIIIMPGSGIRSHNIAELLEQTGAKEIHSSALRESKELEMVDEEEVRKMVERIKKSK